MSIAIQVAGASPVWVDTASSHTLEQLGLTANGGQIRFNGFFGDVPVDDSGGDLGPPADVQFFGETAEITLDFTKFDEAVAQKIRPRLYGGTAGTIGTVGSLMIAGSLTYRLVVLSAALTPLNFPVVMFREPFEINKGTKFSTWRVVGTAYKNGSSVLYNATTS